MPSRTRCLQRFAGALALVAIAAGPATTEPLDREATEQAIRSMSWAASVGKAGPDTAENSAELLSLARDVQQPAGVRGQALRAYAAMAARRHDDTAAQAIWDLHGKIGGLMDPTLDALATLGAPALPYLTGLLPSCGRRELAKGRLDDPKATIELEEAGLAASAIQVILDQDAKAKAPGLASKLIATFDCGDATVRQIAAQALGLLETLEGQDAEALRTRLAGDRRDDVRAFSASVLAAHQVADSKTIKLLERALSHRADLVRLSAANALMKLNQPKRAQPTLVQLTRSRDPEIARLAESLLRP